MQVLPMLREQPFFQHHAGLRVHIPSHLSVLGRCAVNQCDHFAKVNSLCLMHSRAMHAPSQESPVRSVSSAQTSESKAMHSPVDSKLKLKNRNRKCRSEACLSYARSGGYCTRHGGGRKCKVENCGTASQTGGFCRLHGGGSRCRIAECKQFARIRGLCLQHNRGSNEDSPQVDNDQH